MQLDPQLKELIVKNTEILQENNKLLKQVRKYQIWGTTMTFLWYALIIGLPFALYFYILEPYFSALGASYDTFSAGMQEIPGFKQFHEALNYYKSK